MATLSVTKHVTDSTTGGECGSISTPVTLTITGNRYSTKVVVADNFGNATAWATGDGGITTFDYLYVESDVEIYVELRNDNSTDEFALFRVAAGHAAIIPGGVVGGYQTTTRIDGAVLVSGTDYGNIDQIIVHNDAAEGVGDATVKMILFD